MVHEIGWLHPKDESDQWDGFNDPGVETFRGSPILHLAREIIQNSLDAAHEGAVDVQFIKHDVETSTIPNVEQLKETLILCRKASKDESDKARDFFETAIAEITKPQVAVLEISDFNTKGMTGPSENGSPYYAFMKAKGQSKKASGTAAGSYGIGKFAPYAVSNVRTIFVSTVYEDKNSGWCQLTQGKSILMSHESKDGRRVGVGFWGVAEKCQPVKGVRPELPAWLQRVNDEADLPRYRGSKISILCFDEHEAWEELLSVSVAENFFAAINSGALRVLIGDKYSLDQSTIADFLGNEEMKDVIKGEKDEPDKFNNSGYYLATMQDSNEVIVEHSEQSELGQCELRILVREGFPKKVCALRNGMLITDSLNRLKVFSDFKEFAAVFECKSKKGNELLRAMEPPRHDDFEPNFLGKQEKRGKKALSELAQWIKDMLKRHAKDPVSEVTSLDELKDFFGEEGEDGSGQGSEEMNPQGNVIIRARPLKQKVLAPSKPNNANGNGGGSKDGGGGGAGNAGKGAGDGGDGGGKIKPAVALNNVRAIISGNAKRIVAFTPTQTSTVAIRLQEAGADVDYDVAIVKSDIGIVHDGRVQFDVVAGQRYKLEIELSDEFLGAVKVVANEI